MGLLPPWAWLDQAIGRFRLPLRKSGLSQFGLLGADLGQQLLLEQAGPRGRWQIANGTSFDLLFQRMSNRFRPNMKEPHPARAAECGPRLFQRECIHVVGSLYKNYSV